MRFKAFISSRLSTVITTILIGMMAVSCIMDDVETDSEAMLEIGVSLSDLKGQTKAYADPVEGETMKTVRFIIVRENGYVEHNRKVDLEVASSSLQKVSFKVVANEMKSVWIVANEENSMVPIDFGKIAPGAPCPSDFLRESLITFNSADEQMDIPLPMTSYEKFHMPSTDHQESILIYRAATKFTFLITNQTTVPLYLTRVNINKAARKGYLFPRILAFDESSGITDFEVPTVGNNEYYTFSKEYKITLGQGSTSILDPIYLNEGRFTGGGAGKKYAISVTVNGLEFSGDLTELDLLPRNTHTVVNITFKRDGSSFYLDWKVTVLPYSEVVLKPGFGQ